jgi:hypothetical protein
MSNVFETLANVIAGLEIGNIDTMQTHNTTLNFLTETNAQLTTAWTTGMPENPGSTVSNNMAGYYYNVLVFDKAGQENCQGNTASPTSSVGPNDMATFILEYMTELNLYQFSQALGTDIMNVLSSPNIYTTSAGPSQMNTVNQFISLISSSAGQDEKIGQTESQTESSVAQNDASTQQSLADMGSVINQVGSNPANILQQSF